MSRKGYPIWINTDRIGSVWYEGEYAALSVDGIVHSFERDKGFDDLLMVLYGSIEK